MNRPLIASILCSLAATVSAQPAPYPEPPSLPPASYQGETVEPDVTILQTERGLIYEYRVKGQLYMVKIQPPVGPPYFLLDTNGDGVLDAERDRVWNNAVPQWILYSW
jgi:hypothetical protein